ncbi:MAG: hypothetical protein IH823_06750 [Candidatus Dadabacteria bacterium]|nr:hypothetical protein [Candidatus Dadabacteria bacterium]
MVKDEYINKQIIVFSEDGSNKVSRKDGICSANSNTEIELDNEIIIQKSRIVRIEVER